LASPGAIHQLLLMENERQVYGRDRNTGGN